MSENIIDFLICNQGLSILVVLFVAAGTSALLHFILGPNLINDDNYHSTSAAVVQPAFVRSNLQIYLSFIFLGFGLLSFVLGWEPVPRTLGLSLPPITSAVPRVDSSGAAEEEREENGNKHLLIFLHGWRGSDRTWEQFYRLAEDDQNLQAKLMAINYPHYLQRRQLDINGLSEFIAEELRNEPEFNQSEKVAIVAHSMGGLIARRISVLTTITVGDPKPIGLLIEIATPHEGADLAGLADRLGLRGELVSDMKRNSTFLNILAGDWSRLGERRNLRPASHCFYSPQDRVVDPSSAKAGCDSDRPYTNGGHRAVVRPENREDFRYRFPISRVKEYFELR